MRAEELGTLSRCHPSSPLPTMPFPMPSIGPGPEQDPASIFASGPSGADLDAFLSQKGLAPFPMRLSNTRDLNPWKADIEGFLGRPLAAPPAEGRPPGEGWAHQRWNEFFPQVFLRPPRRAPARTAASATACRCTATVSGNSAPAGSTTRLRDPRSRARPRSRVRRRASQFRFHPRCPFRTRRPSGPSTGTLPPKLLMARYGEAVLMRHYNALPIDPAANRGFGLHTITTHEHNGHSPGESDGFTNAFFFPGQFYDYRWPIQLAGYDTINTTAIRPPGGFSLRRRGNPLRQRCQSGPEDLRKRVHQDPRRLARDDEHPLVP